MLSQVDNVGKKFRERFCDIAFWMSKKWRCTAGKSLFRHTLEVWTGATNGLISLQREVVPALLMDLEIVSLKQPSVFHIIKRKCSCMLECEYCTTIYTHSIQAGCLGEWWKMIKNCCLGDEDVFTLVTKTVYDCCDSFVWKCICCLS